MLFSKSVLRITAASPGTIKAVNTLPLPNSSEGHKPLNKIGVMLNHADTFHHFRNLLALLDPESFEIVIANDRQALEKIAQEKGYSYHWYQDLIQQPPRYRYTLSNYFIYYYDVIGEAERKVYLTQLLGKHAIRMMYTLGIDHWNYADWNQLYDIQLCYGPWAAERLEQFKAEIHQVGYPRYDDFFNHPPDKQSWLERLGADPEKPTIVWLPTRHQHTLRAFGKTVASLSDRYNVLIKPHPLTWQEEPGLIQWLKMLPLTRLVEKELDNLYLYSISDFVFCDYGGASFGALYTDRKLLLFNHYPSTRFDPVGMNLPPDSPTHVDEINPTEQYLRGFIPNIAPDQQYLLSEMLIDEALWAEQQKIRANLRDQFFAPYYGNSAARVAEILKDCLARPETE